MGDALIGQELFRARNDPCMNGAVGDGRILHSDQCDRRAALLGLGHAEFQQAGVPHPVIDRRPVGNWSAGSVRTPARPPSERSRPKVVSAKARVEKVLITPPSILSWAGS